MRGLTLVNCWSINRTESYALWKIYLEGSKTGVAVKSTVSKLKKAIENETNSFEETIYLGKVDYSDYLPENGLNRFKIVTTKKEFYEFENELRLFILHYPKSEGGVNPPYDLEIGRNVNIETNTLVDEIYLSPFAGSWFQETLKETVKKIKPNLTKRLVTSSIRD